MPGVAFPLVGRLGLTSPPSAVLCSAKTARYPSRVASLPLASQYLVCFLGLCSVRLVRARKRSPSRQGSWSPGTPRLPRVVTRRLLALSSFRVPPLSACPALRPRWCPAHLAPCLRDCCLPDAPRRRLSLLASSRGYPTGPQLYSFRGSITRPAPSLPPAPYLLLRERTRVHY
jgi:hypothetical protein